MPQTFGQIDHETLAAPRHWAPFWISLIFPILAVIEAAFGGWTLILLPASAWWFFAVLDGVTGTDNSNADPDAPDTDLTWYRRLTTVWVPVQAVTLFGLIAWVAPADHLSGWEKVGLFAGVGVITGAIGINYSHELMHRADRLERWLADVLLAMVLYSHFRSEHLLVHHSYVGTPRDPVTALYNEGFHRFLPRVLLQCPVSAFYAESGRLARRNRPWYDLSNPFYRYAGLQAAMLILAGLLGGWVGLGLFLVQAVVAVWQLELVNYVEHYGLTRRHLGDGRYEPVQPHHAWNAGQKASNRLLINLQRHTDHHLHPTRRFPLLQALDANSAPLLPYGYPVMTVLAMIPPLWRRMMNPRVRAWRQAHYPDIKDWKPYYRGGLPMPGRSSDQIVT
ncbi:MAG: alkane 1-monooxygenase [Ruegeria sp.]